jgi:hypothetical protein
MSLIHTRELNGTNPFDYLTGMQRHAEELKRKPRNGWSRSGQARKPAKMFRAGLYARVSTNDQQTLPMQSRALQLA